MTLRLAALAALFTWAVCRISWPGFMSFDSMYALRQARTGIEAATYPPMVSYLWALCERFIPGQGGMFIAGNALVFFGVGALGRALGAGDFRILLAMLLVAWAPVTLGPMLVVWKDVAFGGLMAIAYAVTLRYVDRRRPALLAAAIVALALASSFRLNGVAAAVPALAAIAWTMCGPPYPDPDRVVVAGERKRLLASSLLFVGLFAVSFGFVVATSTWRLPDFKRIGLPTGNVGIQLHDLLGISICEGRNLLPPSVYSGEMTPERLLRIYHPEHIQRSFGRPPLLDEAVLEANGHVLEAPAAAARIEHPWCYLQHRTRIFLHGVGANSGPVFYLVQPDVYPGEAHTEATPTDLTADMVRYILDYESSIFARGFFYALLAVAALLAASRGAYRPRMRRALLPMAGACAYLLGSFFVMPAADARYNFWPNLVFMVTFCCVLPVPRLPAAIPASMTGQFVRYASVGAAGTAVHYLTLIGLVQGFRTGAVVASTAGFIAGAFVNYALNYRLTFASERAHRVALPRFFAVAGAGLLLNALVMAAILALLPLHYLIAQIVATAVVLITGFLANRRWTF